MRERYVFMAVIGALLALAVVLALQVVQLRGELERVIEDYEELVSQTPQEGGVEVEMPEPVAQESRFTFPIASSDYLALTSPFGYRVSPVLQVERYHQGVDIAATWRAQVVAIADGVVVEHWPPPDGYYRGHDVYGGLVVIEHEEGWRSLYAHLSETRIHQGWQVRAGQVIGRVGATGLSDGAHLHFEIIAPDGERKNPLLYVTP
jgi:murein DD-endopeptidase MepM/ murein hydrolase activator NlpD